MNGSSISDPRRPERLRGLGILDAPAEEAFDRLTRLAASVLDVPAAFISLTDGDRDFLLSHRGLGEPLASSRELRGETLCHRAIASDGPLVSNDARAEPSFRGVAGVESLGAAAYVAVPLRLCDGTAIGAFCAIDVRPRSWSERDIQLLTELAACALGEIELREAKRAAEAEQATYRELLGDLDAIAWEFDLATWRFRFVSPRAEAILGYTAKRWSEEPEFWENQVLHPEDRDWAIAFCKAATERGRDHEFDYRAVASDGRVVWVKDRVRVVADEAGKPRLLRGVMIDITAEKKAAEALGQAEERFRELAENIGAVFWLYDFAEGRRVYVSSAYDRVWGRPREELTAEPRAWTKAVHPEDRDRVVASMDRLHGGDFELEYRIVRPDGEVRWIHERAFPVRDASGATYRAAGVAEDITDQKRAAERLRESEEKFRQIADNVRGAFWIFDASFTVPIYVSRAYEELWGRSLESLYENPRSFLQAVHPDDVERLTSAMAAVAQGPVTGIEYRVVRSDGTVRWAFSRGYPVRDENGEVYRVVGTTEDITERKRTQEKLEAAEAHYRRLVENAPYAIYARDADGCFIELNPAGERLLERGPGELIGEHFSTVIAPADLEVATTAFERVISGESDNLAFEERVVTASGEERLIHLTESAIRERGVIVGTHGVGRDITGEFEKDRQLRRAERLASIGTLVGGVAHELNNPLQSIRSFATLLLERSDSEEEREDLAAIRREALRASGIVGNLQMLTTEAGNEPRERTPVDLNDVVRHVLATRRYAIDTHNITLHQDLADDLPAVDAHGGQLEQVVLNLVVNAEQALEEAPRKQLTIQTRAGADGVSLHVADSGIGIAPGNLEHIFDPFFTTRSPGEGTGLGLAVVYSIITEHGGTVFVESEPGVGTVFRVALPASVQPEPAPDSAPAPPVPLRPLRILVVDDEPSIRDALSRYLVRRRGHTVDEAPDGEEALRILEGGEADYDVILSDLRMPGLGGDELLIRLRESGTGLDRRLIFLTGDAASGYAARVLAAASVPVLYKPAELAEIADRIERHAEEARRGVE